MKSRIALISLVNSLFSRAQHAFDSLILPKVITNHVVNLTFSYLVDKGEFLRLLLACEFQDVFEIYAFTQPIGFFFGNFPLTLFYSCNKGICREWDRSIQCVKSDIIFRCCFTRFTSSSELNQFHFTSQWMNRKCHKTPLHPFRFDKIGLQAHWRQKKLSTLHNST